MTIPAHAYEVLTADWCKYNDCLVATGSVDKSIKVWDLRRPDKEVLVLYGHGYAHSLGPHSLCCLSLV